MSPIIQQKVAAHCSAQVVKAAPMLKVCERFVSVEGEGPDSGIPSAFIRLQGCNLNCWTATGGCDTAYAHDINTPCAPTSVSDLVTFVADSKVQRVLVTGGEPLCQQQALGELLQHLWTPLHALSVVVETNGSYAIPPQWIEQFRHVTWSVDYKLPSTGVCNRMFWPNYLGLGGGRGIIKFVCTDNLDCKHALAKMQAIHNHYSGINQQTPPLIIQPKWDDTMKNARTVAQFVLSAYRELPTLRFSLQMHKVVFGKNTRM